MRISTGIGDRYEGQNRSVPGCPLHPRFTAFTPTTGKSPLHSGRNFVAPSGTEFIETPTVGHDFGRKSPERDGGLTFA